MTIIPKRTRKQIKRSNLITGCFIALMTTWASIWFTGLVLLDYYTL